MVKPRQVGKQRSFLRGLVFTVLTLGLYGIYWTYKAPHEVYDQFDLDDEGRDEGILWFALSLAVPFLLLVYYWKMVANVRYVRERLALRPGITPGGFVGIQAVAYLALFGFALAALAEEPQIDPSAETLTPEEQAALERFLALYVAGLVAYAVLAAIAYYMLQGSINGIWDGYAARMRELGAAPLVSAGPAPAASGEVPPLLGAPKPAPPSAPGPFAGGCPHCGSRSVRARAAPAEPGAAPGLEYVCWVCGRTWRA